MHLLSAYQSRCAVLLQGQGQLQQSLSELRRQAREAQMLHLDSDAALQSTQARLETVEQQLRTALQQGRLYDGEIRSLRSLLETYDLEFRIGKPDADKMMSLKDRLIAELRAELDAARQSASALATHVKNLEAAVDGGRTVVTALQGELQQVRDELSQAQTQAASLSSSAGRDSPVTASAFSAEDHPGQQDLEHEVTALRTQVETAQHDLQYLQYVTGLDYFPDRTRVLHLAENPTSHAPAVITMPSVTELRKQRTELKKQLNAAQAEALQAQHDAATSAANAVTSTAPVHAPTPAPAPTAVSAPQLEIVNQRLKEQFKEKIASFREAVYLIFGYKVGAVLVCTVTEGTVTA
jgi:predicted  nucleic acid-binding Zn-ribbon protein